MAPLRFHVLAKHSPSNANHCLPASINYLNVVKKIADDVASLKNSWSIYERHCMVCFKNVSLLMLTRISKAVWNF